MPHPDQDEDRSRAGPDQGPAQTEDRAPDEVSGKATLFGDETYLFTVDVLHTCYLDSSNDQDAEENRGTDDSVHVEGVEEEHLLNAVPRNDLGFSEDDPEKNAG